MTLRSVSLNTAVLFVGMIGILSDPSVARPQDSKVVINSLDTSVQLNLKDASLSDAIRAIAKTDHINVLVDGEPIVVNGDLKFNGTVREALDRIAGVYDYTWSLSKSGSVLMSKRFKNPGERPQLNSNEVTQMAQEIINGLSVLGIAKDDQDWNQIVDHLGHSFTASQNAALVSPEGLRGVNLTVDQQRLLREVKLYNTLHRPLLLWQWVLPLIEGIESSKLVTKKRSSEPNGSDKREYEYLYVYKGTDGTEHDFVFPQVIYSNSAGAVITP